MALYTTPFVQIVEDVMNELRESSTESAVKDKYRRRVNHIYQSDIPSRYEWDWLRATDTIVLTARYNTGTIATTNASANVTGTDTVWASAHTGQKIKISGDDHIYTFTQASGTTGTLSPTYYGDTESGMSYEIYQDTYALPTDFAKFPITGVPIYYYNNGHRCKVEWTSDKDFRRFYSYQPNMYPTKWREHPDKTSAGLYQIELSPPVIDARQLEVEYLKAMPEMIEITAASHAATACTATKIITTANQYGSITAGMYLRCDSNDDIQWVRITAVAVDTTTGAGITIETMREVPGKSEVITASDAPDMPYQLHRALFYGACALTAAEQNDPALRGYTAMGNDLVNKDIARIAKKRYGKKTFGLGNWR